MRSLEAGWGSILTNKSLVTQTNGLRLTPKRTSIPKVLEKSNWARPNSLLHSNCCSRRATSRQSHPIHHQRHHQSHRSIYIIYGYDSYHHPEDIKIMVARRCWYNPGPIYSRNHEGCFCRRGRQSIGLRWRSHA